MNHDEPTDAQLEELLGTYAEALYQSSVVPDGGQEQPASDGITVTNTNQKAKPMESNPEQEAALVVNLQERPDGGSSKGKILALVGGLLVVAAVGIGAVSLLSNNDTSEVSVAETPDDVAEEESTEAAADDSEAESDTVDEASGVIAGVRFLVFQPIRFRNDRVR